MQVKSIIEKSAIFLFFTILIPLVITIILLLLPILIVIEISIIIINKIKKSTKIDVSSRSENEKTSAIKTFNTIKESVNRTKKKVRFTITNKEGVTTEEEVRGIRSVKITIKFTINDDDAGDLNDKQLTIENFIDQSEFENKFNIINNKDINLKNQYLFGIYIDNELFSYIYIQNKQNFPEFTIYKQNKSEYNPIIDQINDIAIYKIIEHEKKSVINRSKGNYLYFWVTNKRGFDQVTRKKSDFGINDPSSISRKLQSSNIVNNYSSTTKAPTISHKG